MAEAPRTFSADVVFWPGLVMRLVFAALMLVFVGYSTFLWASGTSVSPFGPLLIAGVLGYLWFFYARKWRSGKTKPPHSVAWWEVSSDEGRFVAVHAKTKQRVSIAKSRIKSGHIEPQPGGWARVVLDGGIFGEIVESWHPNVAEARAFLDDLGLSPLKRPASYAFFFGLQVTVGIDGVVASWPLLRKRRFIAHSKITNVRWTDDHVWLELASGGVFEIMTNGTRNKTAHAALVERLIAAREAFAASEGSEPIEALARGGRSHDAWVRELRALSESAGSQYRSASLPAETLWRIALDPTEKPDLRIGATLALRAGLDDEGKARLRDAAEAAASPRVRVALTAVADTDDDEILVEALSRNVVPRT